MEIEQIKLKFHNALNRFLDRELYLLEHDASERSITHKLAEHLQSEFPEHHVDCEYNRNGARPKTLQFRFNEALRSEVYKLAARAARFAEELGMPENEYEGIDVPIPPFSTYPDIIVHTRGRNHPSNLLVIEVKKLDAASEDDVRFDEVKLEAFTSDDGPNPYRYRLGVHLELGCLDSVGEQPRIRYFRDGRVEQ